MTDTRDALDFLPLTDDVEWGNYVNIWKGYFGKAASA